jgi:hypothetical protein
VGEDFCDNLWMVGREGKASENVYKWLADRERAEYRNTRWIRAKAKGIKVTSFFIGACCAFGLDTGVGLQWWGV